MRHDALALLGVRLLAGCLAMFAVGAAWSWVLAPSFPGAVGALLMLASVPAMLASGPRGAQPDPGPERRLGIGALGAGLFTVGVLALAG
ncbi:hypothetical protein [Nocardioides pantholopis]|uniref:hypothetical protein n=1 Tax=Nocardioides pantholopis TaxID=2483798 RepID=UPI000F083A50|nr:hypothetical protein [Nocardioides pantholopis]